MNRELKEIVRRQQPVMLDARCTVEEACRLMHEKRIGAVLVTRDGGSLAGIFTGRDAVRALAHKQGAAACPLLEVMTSDPTCLPPGATAIDALRLMWDCGFRHVPIVDQGRIVGIVSKGDFRGMEHDRLDEETGIWERMR